MDIGIKTALTCLLAGCPVVYMTPSLRMRNEAFQRFVRELDNQGYGRYLRVDFMGMRISTTQYPRACIQFLSSQFCGASCEHVPVLILENSHMMTSEELAEAEMIPSAQEGFDRMVVYCYNR